MAAFAYIDMAKSHVFMVGNSHNGFKFFIYVTAEG
jgi:hypothetical protein